MDIEPSLNQPSLNAPTRPYQADQMALLNFAAPLLKPSQFETNILLHPGTQAHPPYGLFGDFFITFNVYKHGKKIIEYNSEACNEKGFLELNLNPFLDMYDDSDDQMLLVQYRHNKKVPVELYISNTHKKTGTYISYPGLPFMGDEIYVHVHAQQLENTIFWPGLSIPKDTKAGIFFVNPFGLTASYQFSLFYPNGENVQSKVFKLGKMRNRLHDIEEIFPDQKSKIDDFAGRCAVCVASQYKVVCYFMMQNKTSGAVTLFDHLHNYCLF